MSFKIEDFRKQLTLLFRTGEGVCVSKDEFGTTVISLEQALELAEPVMFVCVNPLDKTKDNDPCKPYHRADLPRRADANITAYHTIPLEIDEDPDTGQPMPLDKQIQYYIDKSVPYAILNYSGSKSVHAFIVVKDGFENREEYDRAFKICKWILPAIDGSVKNPSRLMRASGAVRNNGKLQELIDIGAPITRKQFYKWAARFDKLIKAGEDRERQSAIEAQAKLSERRSIIEAGGVPGFDSLQEHVKDFIEGRMILGAGRRHNFLCFCVREFIDCGLDYKEAQTLAVKAYDSQGIPERESEALGVVDHYYLNSNFRGA